MASLNRRASSLPARAAEIATGSHDDLVLLQSEVEARVATSPPLQEPRSPPVVATFSPVFDLELGGSCGSTPQYRRCRGSHTPQGGVSRRCVTAAVAPISLHPFPAATPAAAALQKLPNTLSQMKATNPAITALSGSTGLDRSVSDLQVMWARRNSGGAAASANTGTVLLNPSGERLAELCKPTSDLEQELARQLRAFRAARITSKQSASSADLIPARPSSSLGASSPQPPQQQPPLPAIGPKSADVGSPSGPTPGEIEALASELQSAGFLVQILDGTRLSKDARSCLRTLKHRFLVCLGRVPAPMSQTLQRQSVPGKDHDSRAAALCSLGLSDAAACGSASAGGDSGGDGACKQELKQQPQPEPRSQSQLQGGPEELLTEPLVVEVRFREQFLIANPTQAYQLLLLSIPVVFVGPFGRLDAVVDLMAAEVAAVFKEAKRPLPPWRTKGAMLSKWAPAQLGELGRLMRCAVPPQPHQLLQGQPLEGLAKREKSSGSAIGVHDMATAEHAIAAAAAAATVAAMARDPLSEPLKPWPRLGRSIAEDIVRATAAAGAVVGAAGGDDITDDERSVAHRSNSAPPRTAAGPRSAVAAAGDSGVLTQSETGIEVTHLDSLDQLMRQTLTSLSQVEPAVAAVVVAERNVRSIATIKQHSATRVAPLGSPPTEPTTDAIPRGDAAELSFPILPEISPMPDAGRMLAAIRPTGRDGHESVPVTNPIPSQPPPQQQPPPPSLLARASEANSTAAAPPPAVVPTLQPYRGLSSLSPFACVLVPAQCECEHNDQDSPGVGSYHCGSDGERPAPGSDRLSTVAGDGCHSRISYATPEFTFNHSALNGVDPTRGMYGEDLDLACRDAPGGSELRLGPSLPLPKPTRPPSQFAATDSSAGTIMVAARHPTEACGIIPAASPFTSGVATNSEGMNLAHQPLAKGALHQYRGGAADATAAAAPSPPAAAATAATADPSRPAPPAITHLGGIRCGGGGACDYNLPFAGKPETLHITRRSSSDLHRAAEKFKKATSLLAVALRLTKGSGGCSDSRDAGAVAPSESGDIGSLSAVERSGAYHGDQQQQQQQQQHTTIKPTAAATTASAVAGAAQRPAGGGVGGGLQVALAGGVMTQPSGDAPPWARIRTVKWNQSTTACAAAPPAAAPLTGPEPAPDI
ncbi:hypothetical protein Vretimale_15290 [Volvox reticuliferus]|uniref:Uncharacterized protein n=1 Tax=Volvox reticuliferus TaxID=1737510 RepID=A0A8J4GRK0_9CHLO|nr:hypothetical protein Vretifemale_5468 [Volvox reticuliferus]GIM11834.1 hypothetical protein Vretimale_15290 [Volvox reticuliferus]